MRKEKAFGGSCPLLLGWEKQADADEMLVLDGKKWGTSASSGWFLNFKLRAGSKFGFFFPYPGVCCVFISPPEPRSP